MTRRPKTPRTRHQRFCEAVFGILGGHRRQPKGRRAKSGQWWPREDAKKRARQHRKLFPDYFRGKLPQAEYQHMVQGAW